MKTTNKTAEMKDRKVILTILWIFVMFNFTIARSREFTVYS